MTRMAVITKSFAPDLELCTALNHSVLDNAPSTVQHHIIVPRSDLKLFGRLAGPRTLIRCEADLLPRAFVRVPLSNIMVNLGRPFPPVRGWIQQQVIKLAAIAASEDDVVLVADSDVEFVRPFTAEMFVRNDTVRLFRKPNQIDNRLSRHLAWHRVARALLGLPPAEPPYADYIASPLAWDPMIVKRMLARVAATTGRPWPTAIAGQLDFSECVLYGVFVDGVIGAPANSFVSDDPLCLSYWSIAPLNLDSAAHFIRGIRPTDVAAMIPSKSRTPLAVREAIFSALRSAHGTGTGLQGQAEGH
jgi:hypothetical protein